MHLFGTQELSSCSIKHQSHMVYLTTVAVLFSLDGSGIAVWEKHTLFLSLSSLSLFHSSTEVDYEIIQQSNKPFLFIRRICANRRTQSRCYLFSRAFEILDGGSKNVIPNLCLLARDGKCFWLSLTGAYLEIFHGLPTESRHTKKLLKYLLNITSSVLLL